MTFYFSEYIAHAFEEILHDLYYDPDFVASPRGMEVKEIRDCSIEIENPMMNLYKNKYRSSPKKYIAAELLWYFAGTNNPTFIEKYASLWKQLHNPDGTVNSAYGHLIFDRKNEHGFSQYGWVIESLTQDKDSRQAFMHFNTPDHQRLDNKDQVCTLQALFHIRDNKLYMTVTMRSNDVIFGFMTDFAFFSVLQYHVYMHMKEVYEDLELGSYTHISHSMHLYERHYDLVKKMLDEPFEVDKLPLLTERVIKKSGQCFSNYEELLHPIKKEGKLIENFKTDNALIEYCFDKCKSS